METGVLEKIQMLPVDKQQEVIDFVDFLIAKTQPKVHFDTGEIKAGFGGGKGLIAYMADDFDDPLEEFKDYM